MAGLEYFISSLRNRSNKPDTLSNEDVREPGKSTLTMQSRFIELEATLLQPVDVERRLAIL